MFAPTYFPERYFAPRYFPAGGSESSEAAAAPVVAGVSGGYLAPLPQRRTKGTKVRLGVAYAWIWPGSSDARGGAAAEPEAATLAVHSPAATAGRAGVVSLTTTKLVLRGAAKGAGGGGLATASAAPLRLHFGGSAAAGALLAEPLRVEGDSESDDWIVLALLDDD